MTIKFYRPRDPYGEFSNFSRHPIKLDGHVWKTNEHYFQAQKYIGTIRYEMIANAPTPREAANLGRDRSIPLRTDWEDVKDDVMRKCILEKFSAYPQLQTLLIDTEDQEIIEDSPVDYYWGCGLKGTGKNMLGKILMEVREILKNDTIEQYKEKLGFKGLFFVTVIANTKNVYKPLETKSRCWGWYEKEEIAKEKLINESCDISEGGLNNFAVIEKVSEGIMPDIIEIQWYKYDKMLKKYELCDKPDWSKDVAHWSLS